ncbi:MAG: hypothetical protein L0H74_09230 [Brachybacterium sp.]|nr:hypothetical protein [Brachybacterium sp.]MDN5900237.1 hypothetical protein [Brachybacterium sp.]
MTDGLWFLWAALSALALAYLPGTALARLLGISWRTSAVAAPAITACVFGIGAIVAGLLEVPWTLLSAVLATLLSCLLALGLGAVLTRIHRSRRPDTAQDPGPVGSVRALFPSPWTALVVLTPAVALATAPILVSFGSPGQPLQRWDALFHLSALQWIQETGFATTLRFSALATTDGSGGIYPAGFHDIAALVPMAPVPIVLNAATLVLALVPWLHGTMFLARALWPRLSWAPLASGAAAAIAPAIPMSEWIHLAAIPNLVAAAFLPGVLGVIVVGFRALRLRLAGYGASRAAPLMVAAALGAVGIGLVHPNVFIAMCLLVAAAGLASLLEHRRRRPRLSRLSAVVVLVALLPVVVIATLPASGVAGDFVGGLAISPLRAVGELILGLLTVWPMATGPLLWLLGYVGLWALLRRGSFILPAVLVVPVVLYLDAAVDSPLRLSALWYSGQDRISLFLTLLVCLLVVPGLAHLERLVLRGAHPTRRLLRLLALILCVLVAASTVGPRSEYAERNLDLDRTGRPRYFDTAEYEMLLEVSATMDPDKLLLASPFSGGAHLYGIAGQNVRFPAAGMTPSPSDDERMDDVLAAPDDPAACRRLLEANIGYVYADTRPYNFGGNFTRLDEASPELGRVIGSTDHSMMIEIDCETGPDEL